VLVNPSSNLQAYDTSALQLRLHALTYQPRCGDALLTSAETLLSLYIPQPALSHYSFLGIRIVLKDMDCDLKTGEARDTLEDNADKSYKWHESQEKQRGISPR
jgi:hypothetical protein